MDRRVVWKFKLHPNQPLVYMPRGATILTAAAIGDDIYLWAVVNPDAPNVAVGIVVVPTGFDTVLDNAHYINTVFLEGGALVFHIFEVK